MTSGQNNRFLSHAFCPLSTGDAAEACCRVGDGVCSAQYVCLRSVSNGTFDVVLPVRLNLVPVSLCLFKSGSPG